MLPRFTSHETGVAMQHCGEKSCEFVWITLSTMQKVLAADARKTSRPTMCLFTHVDSTIQRFRKAGRSRRRRAPTEIRFDKIKRQARQVLPTYLLSSVFPEGSKFRVDTPRCEPFGKLRNNRPERRSDRTAPTTASSIARMRNV